MDGWRAPNGIGHLMISFMAGGIIPTIYIHNHSFNFSGGVWSLGIANYISLYIEIIIFPHTDNT